MIVTPVYLTPLEFLDKLAVLIPPPRKHRHRYHGVLAPNAPLRLAVTAYAGLPMDDEAVSTDQLPVADEDPSEAGSKTPSCAASLWAMLIARIYEVWMKYIRVFHTTCSFQLPKSVLDGFVRWFVLNAVAR